MKQQGKLTIFLGYAAGVGKTYTMLEVARQKQAQGVDVVCGYIEPHQRPQTSALIEGLEVIAPLAIEYKGLKLFELDLEAALRRKPQLILVDELAHTNAPESRHVKRYQDITELLRNGIDVYTTVNIQHLESLNDLVETVSGIVVHETVPDHIFNQAETVTLIDITPEELIQRLKDGKIYQKAQADRALQNFFSKETLVALREISLRKTADQILHQSYREALPVITETILVCLSAAPSNAKVIRTAARMVEAFHGSLIAVYVKDDYASDADTQALKQNMTLAEQLGAQTIVLYGEDVALQIAEYARMSRVTKIVIGRSVRPHRLFLKPSIIEKLTTHAPNIDIYVIPDAQSGYRKYKQFHYAKEKINARDGLVALSIVVGATMISELIFYQSLHIDNMIMIYMLAVQVIALVTLSRFWSLVASFVAVLLFNYLYVSPRFSSIAVDSGYIFTLITMFLVSILSSNVAIKLRQKNAAVIREVRRTEIMLDTSLQLQQASTPERVVSVIGKQIQKLLDTTIIIYTPETGLLVPTVFSEQSHDYIHEVLLSKQERAIAAWVYENNKRAGAKTNTLANGKCYYLAIRSGPKVMGVLAIEWQGSTVTSYEQNILSSLTNEAGLALETIHLDQQAQKQDLEIAQEKLRSNILRTISHDLRTPLTSIKGNAALLQASPSMDEKARMQVYHDIETDATWLNDLVENLLTMTRIQNDESLVHKDIEVLEDIIENSIAKVKSKLQGRTLKVHVSDPIQLVRVDPVLLLHVVINLLDNAIKYTPKTSTITIETITNAQTITLRIFDDGPGIADKEAVFDMFYPSHMDGQRGMGLGLYLVREIMKAHNSDVILKDVHPHGACFEIELERGTYDETHDTHH